jgi:hypothetical protein
VRFRLHPTRAETMMADAAFPVASSTQRRPLTAGPPLSGIPHRGETIAVETLAPVCSYEAAVDTRSYKTQGMLAGRCNFNVLRKSMAAHSVVRSASPQGLCRARGPRPRRRSGGAGGAALSVRLGSGGGQTATNKRCRR